MTKREFALNEFFNEIKENKIKEKDKKFLLYKELGILKEETNKKTYDELVNEEIHRMKNKQKLYENVKNISEEENKREDEYSKRLFSFWKRLFIFYAICFVIVFYQRYQKIKKMEIQEKRKIEEKEIERFSNMIYIGGYKF